MPFKVTLFIQQTNYTSSETHYDVSSTTLLSAINNAVALCAARVQILGALSQIAAVRILNTAIPRVATYLAPGSFASTGPFVAGVGGVTTADRAYSALMLTLIGSYSGSALTAIKKLYLTGIPDEVLGDSPFSGSSGVISLGVINAGLQSYLQFLSTLYGFRQKVYTAEQNVQQVLTSAGFPGEVGVQVANQITFTGALSLNFKGFRKVNVGAPGLSGSYYVDPLSPPLLPGAAAPWIYYLQNTPYVQPANIKTRGLCAPQAWQYAQYYPTVSAGGSPPYNPLRVQATHRKRGARELAPSGRSRRLPR